MEYAPRRRYVGEFVLVDGMGRAGKFLLASLLAAFERMEFLQEFVLMDHLLHLCRLGKVDQATCAVLLQTHLDLQAFYMMIGRNLNGRLHDLSSIHNAPEPERFLARALAADERSVVESILGERRLPLFIAHDALANAGNLVRIFPEVKLVEVVRHPAAVIRSWHRRGWGRRIGNDPRAFDVNFAHAGRPVPWFALDWAAEYHALPELDRVVRSVSAIFAKARAGYEECSAEQKSRVAFVAFEQLLRSPREVLAKLERFLGRAPGERMARVLARERLPRELAPGQERLLAGEIRAGAQAPAGEGLERLSREYEDYWLPLAGASIS